MAIAVARARATTYPAGVSESWLIERTSDGRGWRLANSADQRDLISEIFKSKRLAIDFAVSRAARLRLRILATDVADDRVVLEVEPLIGRPVSGSSQKK
jgi:hypothetical protein